MGRATHKKPSLLFEAAIKGTMKGVENLIVSFRKKRNNPGLPRGDNRLDFTVLTKFSRDPRPPLSPRRSHASVPVRDVRVLSSVPTAVDIPAKLGCEFGQVVFVHLDVLEPFFFPFVYFRLTSGIFTPLAKTIFKLLGRFDRKFLYLAKFIEAGPDSGTKMTAFNPGRESTSPLQPEFF